MNIQKTLIYIFLISYQISVLSEVIPLDAFKKTVTELTQSYSDSALDEVRTSFIEVMCTRGNLLETKIQYFNVLYENQSHPTINLLLIDTYEQCSGFYAIVRNFHHEILEMYNSVKNEMKTEL